MKLKSAVLALVFVFVIIGFAFSADPILIKIGTGKENGVYNSVAGKFLQQQLGPKVPSELIQSNGSLDNIDRLKSGEIDLAFCQFDALISNSGVVSDFIIIKRLYPEYIHLIVNQNSKKSIKDFDLKKTKFAIGPDGSGTWVTWKGMCSADKSYADIATVPLGGARALSALESRDVDGVLLVGGLGMGDAKQASKDADKYEMCAIDDWDFNNATYKKEKIYEFMDLPSKTYPGLIEGIFKSGIKTITVDAVLITTAKWADANPALYDKVFEATTRTIPNIKLELQNRANK